MKIQNGTRYDGRDLRGLFCACARWVGVDAPSVVRVEYYRAPRDSFAQGYGRTLKVARPARFEENAIDQLGGLAGGGPVLPPTALAKVCSIIEWMVVGEADWYTAPPAWAEGRRVRIKREPKKPAKLTGVAYQEAEIEKLKARVSVWREKRREAECAVAKAKTAIKKLEQGVRDRRGRIRRLQKG